MDPCVDCDFPDREERAERTVRPERVGQALVVCLLAMLAAATVHATEIGYGGDPLRTGWYRNQPGLSPQTVSGGGFGQLFSTPVVGQVYGQPLVYGNSNTLLVVTQANWIYGLDPVTGAVKWSRNVGTPYNASDMGCGDIWPLVGITATPVIDDANGVAYFTSKTYASGSSGAAVWKMHAVSVAGGVERLGFPVVIQGTADNNPLQTFHPTTQNQRPGLLLMNGVVYAAFGSVCDFDPFQGWVVGVSTAGAIASRWVDRSGSNTSGGGIWMSGSGLVSDAPGHIVFVTGNGYPDGSPTVPAPGDSPPADLSSSVVRLTVQADGSLQATAFFTPFNASSVLDPMDGDLGSGGVIALPYPEFGSTAFPNLYAQAGKEGMVYLHDGNALGGYQQGPGGSDQVVEKIGPYGGVWSKPTVWGGDGGWIYIPTAAPGFSAGPSYGYLRAYSVGVDGSGKPTLTLAATSTDTLGFSSSAPIVTSDGTTSGSALLWIVWNPDSYGQGAQLRAYDVLPVNGAFNLRFSAPVGQGSKFTPPGVGVNRLYVGTRDGHVIGFGVPLSAAPNPPSPSRARLGPAHPNPFAGTTTVDLSLAMSGWTRLAIYDVSGRQVRVLLDGEVAAGWRQVVWDGRDEAGARVPAGLYLMRVDSGGAPQIRRVLIVR